MTSSTATAGGVAVPSALRLAPIERPSSWFVRFGQWMSKRRFGRVLTPIQVMYARRPALLAVAGLLDWIRENALTIEPSLRLLILARVSSINRCAFCHDIALAQAAAKQIGPERFAALEDAEHSPLFSERERAALALAEEVTRTRELTSATFERARCSFTDTELVELLWLNAMENYFNLQAHPLGIGSDELYERAQRRYASKG